MSAGLNWQIPCLRSEVGFSEGEPDRITFDAEEMLDREYWKDERFLDLETSDGSLPDGFVSYFPREHGVDARTVETHAPILVAGLAYSELSSRLIHAAGGDPSDEQKKNVKESLCSLRECVDSMERFVLASDQLSCMRSEFYDSVLAAFSEAQDLWVETNPNVRDAVRGSLSALQEILYSRNSTSSQQIDSEEIADKLEDCTRRLNYYLSEGLLSEGFDSYRKSLSDLRDSLALDKFDMAKKKYRDLPKQLPEGLGYAYEWYLRCIVKPCTNYDHVVNGFLAALEASDFHEPPKWETGDLSITNPNLLASHLTKLDTRLGVGDLDDKDLKACLDAIREFKSFLDKAVEKEVDGIKGLRKKVFGKYAQTQPKELTRLVFDGELCMAFLIERGAKTLVAFCNSLEMPKSADRSIAGLVERCQARGGFSPGVKNLRQTNGFTNTYEIVPISLDVSYIVGGKKVTLEQASKRIASKQIASKQIITYSLHPEWQNRMFSCAERKILAKIERDGRVCDRAWLVATKPMCEMCARVYWRYLEEHPRKPPKKPLNVAEKPSGDAYHCDKFALIVWASES